MLRTWIDPPQTPELQAAAQRLVTELALHPLAAEILARRGYRHPQAARAFLDPEAYQPAPPADLPGMPAAVARLLQALEQGETILVWGDFDVDGQTATALLVGVLRQLGGQVRYHIPVRAVESHGVGQAVLQRLLEEAPPAQVLLTCDTGIADFAALAYARSAGVAVIVTDHHALPLRPPGAQPGSAQPASQQPPAVSPPGETPAAYHLPPALAVITPRLLPNDHPLAGLPGVGVAYKLVEALCAARGRPELAEAQLDLVALGIVADVAVQTGDTRYLLQLGLRRLCPPQRAGLQAVFAQAGLPPGRLREDDIAFALAPRLNALGRLSDANPAVELLTTNDAGRAQRLALQLEGFNTRRQLLTSQTLRSALALIARQPETLARPVLVLAHPAWEPGVIGIVASRLVELYARPVVLFAAPPGQPARGSARSVEGVDIAAAFAAAAAAADAANAASAALHGGETGPAGQAHRALVYGFGGHPMAAGLSLPAENIPEFTHRLAQAVQQQLAHTARPSTGLAVDGYLPWEALDRSLAEALEQLAPFGAGNPPPVLASRDLRLLSRSVVGRSQQHLALTVADAAGRSRRVMWWGGAELIEAHPAGASPGGASPGGDPAAKLDLALPAQSPIDLAYRLRPAAPGDIYGAQVGFQLEWLDMRLQPARPRPPTGPQVIDLRRAGLPLAALHSWLVQAGVLPAGVSPAGTSGAPAGTSGAPAGSGDSAAVQPPAAWQVWAEADAPARLAPVLANWLGVPPAAVPLRSRHQLSPCHTLVIWTIPLAGQALRSALERVQPQQVVLVGAAPPFDTPQAFLERLAGLVKYALAAENGALDLDRLAAALAQRRLAVRRGLDWLAARGDITLRGDPGKPAHPAPGEALSAASGGPADPAQAAAALQELALLLDESRAYRAHFARADTFLLEKA